MSWFCSARSTLELVKNMTIHDTAMEARRESLIIDLISNKDNHKQRRGASK